MTYRLIWILLIIPMTAIASTQSLWHCVVEDEASKQWSRYGAYERVAVSKAFEGCKKESTLPATCRVQSNGCDFIEEGAVVSTRHWQCLALDDQALSFLSAPAAHQDEAIFQAKALCRAKSRVPDTCYVNSVTCTENKHD